MQPFARFILAFLFAAALSGEAFAGDVEYHPTDGKFYLKEDIVKLDGSKAVMAMEGQYTRKGDLFVVPMETKATVELYLQVKTDWIEPVTPPDMPPTLGVPPDAMQMRELHGDVQVALPSDPKTFVPAQEGMTVANGTVIKTGADGTVAVLFGGVESARFMPNSQATVQQTVTAPSRSITMDLTHGSVFSKVGQAAGEVESYKVHTPFGTAAIPTTDTTIQNPAATADFVTFALSTRTDVWIARGTVQVDQPDGTPGDPVTADGAGELKVIHSPANPDLYQAYLASAETLTAALKFIPQVNLKVKALRDKVTAGETLTATEQDYLNRIEKVGYFLRLFPVVAPPPDTTPGTPAVVSPAATPAVPAPVPAAPVLP